MQRLESEDEVDELLGERVSSEGMIQGMINWSGSSGNANLVIPVSGSRGSGFITVIGAKSLGTWEYRVMTLTITDSTQDLNLLIDEAEAR